MQCFIVKRVIAFSLIFFSFDVCHAEAFSVDFDVQDIQKKPFGLISKNTKQSSFKKNTAWRLGTQALFHPYLLKGRGKIEFSNYSQGAMKEFSELDNYLISLGLTGETNSFGYGVSHSSLGKNYFGKYNRVDFPTKDRAINETWLSYTFSDLTVITKYSQSWNNLSNHSDQSWFLENSYNIESKYLLSSTPFSSISLSYNTGKKLQSQGGNHAIHYEDAITSFRTKFEIENQSFQFLIDANHLKSRNKAHTNSNFQKKTIHVSSKLFSQYPLTINPSLHYINTSSPFLSYKGASNNIEPSLSLVYKPLHSPYRYSLTTTYQNLTNNSDKINQQTLKLIAKLDWKSKINSIGATTNWAVDFQFKDINQNAGDMDWSINFKYLWPFN